MIRVKSFDLISPDTFKENVILLDIDGTLVSDHNELLPENFIEKIKILSEKNKVYFASNGSRERSKHFADLCGIETLVCRKPFVGSIRTTIGHESKALVIGDKYLTDGLFAKMLNAEFIKVSHLKNPSDSLFCKISYILDDIISKFVSIVMLIRPWQWVKNLLVLAPVFFGGVVFQYNVLLNALLAVLIFCFVSSAMYVLNDLLDVSQDMLHPRKKFRPLASGELSLQEGKMVFMFLCALSFIGVIILPAVAPFIFCYVLLNIFYSYYLKHIPLLDILCVSAFYVLRILVGGAATGIALSPWIILCVFFGSLFVIVGKRRAEHELVHRRQVLERYSRRSLDLMLNVSATLSVITYAIWSVMSDSSNYLIYSNIFVFIVFLRILKDYSKNPADAESPELLVFKDSLILSVFLVWVAYVFFVLYF